MIPQETKGLKSLSSSSVNTLLFPMENQTFISSRKFVKHYIQSNFDLMLPSEVQL